MEDPQREPQVVKRRRAGRRVAAGGFLVLFAALTAHGSASNHASAAARSQDQSESALLVAEVEILEKQAAGPVVRVRQVIEGHAPASVLAVEEPVRSVGKPGSGTSTAAAQLAVGDRALLMLSPGEGARYELVSAFPLAAAGVARPRGYIPRACGFDLDDDGVAGEAEDCRICDASLAGDRLAGGTADPDGDGIVEDLIYVDCDAGVDRANCGIEGRVPCASIDFAFSHRVDGPGDGAEDIVCFRGTCDEPEGLTPGTSGVPGHWTKRRKGSEARDFQFPTDPAMLVGWDADGDGQYPPFDLQDTAVMHGDPDERRNGNGRSRAFDLNRGTDNDHFEMAHFVVTDYGRDDPDPTAGGFMALNAGGRNGMTHLFLHDLSLRNINRDQPGATNVSTFNWFRIRDYSYLAFINLQVLETGGYFNRGAGTNEPPDAGPVRFQNITYTAHSCDSSGPGACVTPAGAFSRVAKLWGYLSGFEWLDSIFDANVDAWIPATARGTSGAGGIGPAQCAQDFVIRNNEFIDLKGALTVQGWTRGACADPGRPVTGIVFDRNIVRNTYEPWALGDRAVLILGNGPTALRSTGDIKITNNFLSATTAWETAIDIRAGNDGGPNPGTIVIANNTINAEIDRQGFAAIFIRDQGAAFPHQEYVIKNNLVAGIGEGAFNVRADYRPEGWDVSHNVYDPEGSFSWLGGAPMNLRAWRSASGGDTDSAVCVPRLVDPSSGDYHLSPDDSCAQDRGIEAARVRRDIDGEPRPQGLGFDVGADEVPASDSLESRTFLSIASHDGWLRESSNQPGAGGASSASSRGRRAIRLGDDRRDRQWRSIVSFDTSTLPPGAIIRSARLRLRRGKVSGDDPFLSLGEEARVDIRQGGFGGQTELRNGDFEAAETRSRVGMLSAAAADGDWSEAVLDPSGLEAINRSGVTQLRLSFELDDDGDQRNDFVGFYSGESGRAKRPQLVVIYER